MKSASIVIVLGFVGSVGAQTVVPNHLATTEGNSNFFLLVSDINTRTYQETIAASQLTALVGSNINGVQWRLDTAGPAWPPAGGTIADFQVFMGPGVAPTAQSLTFASNYTSAATQVRAGALTFNVGDFTTGGSPNAWGPTVGFNTAYHYTGGNLTFEYRFTGMPTGTPQPSLDAGSAETGQGTDYVSEWGATNTSPTALGLNARFVVTRFMATVPEPATLAVLGLGAIALVRRRRRK